MKNKILIFLTLGLGVISFSPILSKSIRPQFEDGYIKFVAKGGLCGNFMLTPKVGWKTQFGPAAEGELWVRSVQYGVPPFKTKVKPRHQIAEIKLPPEGAYVMYNWAGIGPKSHFRIFCTKRHKGEDQTIDCEKVVEIYDISHNSPCGFAHKHWPLEQDAIDCVKDRSCGYLLKK